MCVFGCQGRADDDCMTGFVAYHDVPDVPEVLPTEKSGVAHPKWCHKPK
jgi:hypothetical protein